MCCPGYFRKKIVNYTHYVQYIRQCPRLLLPFSSGFAFVGWFTGHLSKAKNDIVSDRSYRFLPKGKMHTNVPCPEFVFDIYFSIYSGIWPNAPVLWSGEFFHVFITPCHAVFLEKSGIVFIQNHLSASF